MKKIICILLCAMLLSAPAAALEALTDDAISIDVPSAILIEKTSGTVIYEKNANDRLSPASVTKVMTMLIIMEEIEAGSLSLDEMVTCSDRAATMGGSQIYLKPGEQMSVSDMLKSLAVSSANDCAVALAEHISGTEEAFVSRMNQKAAELGMTNTFFCDCTGLLEDPAHLTTAYDIALMSRELIQYDLIKEYTTIWMDTVRDGEFGLSNTNKLIYYYDGATGLKTGFTRKAMYCLSATAERDGVEYIAVVMHGETSDMRFESAKILLNYAFANYSLASLRPEEPMHPITVELGQKDVVQPVIRGSETLLVEKNKLSDITYQLDIPETVQAPVNAGQELGILKVYSGGELLSEATIVAGDSVDKLSRLQVFSKLFGIMVGAQ